MKQAKYSLNHGHAAGNGGGRATPDETPASETEPPNRNAAE